jgi:abortive infection bacteriophage resistance protein
MITDLERSSKQEMLSDFKQRCAEILKTSVGYYEEQASQYTSKVYDKIRKELSQTILQQLFLTFDGQLKFLILDAKKQFEASIKRI